MVLPVPKPPGMAAHPPLDRGKSTSITLSPVIKGSLGGSLRSEGRAFLAGHSCERPMRIPASVSTIVSRNVYSPAGAAVATFPAGVSGGAITVCRTSSVSRTQPIGTPGPIESPALSAGAKAHFLSERQALASYARLYEGTGGFLEALEGTLDAVVNRSEETGAEADGKGLAQGKDRLSGLHARILLVDLDRRAASVDPDDLAREPGLSDLGHVVESGASQALRQNHRTGDARYAALDRLRPGRGLAVRE